MHVIHSYELQWIQALQEWRGPLSDQLFKFLDFFDRQEFVFILLPAIWLSQNWKVGLKFFYIILMSAVLNYVLKESFGQPRPFHLDANLGIIQVRGFGFPSGAAQSVMLLSGLLLYSCWERKWAWITAANYFLWISFSRIYLGVHFPTDILGGWILGSVLLGVYIYLFPFLEKYLEKQSLSASLILSQVLPLLLILGYQSREGIILGSVAMGVGVGIFICRYKNIFLSAAQSKVEILFRVMVGVSGTFLIYSLTQLLPMPTIQAKWVLQFFLLGLWLSLGSVLVYLFIKSFYQKKYVA